MSFNITITNVSDKDLGRIIAGLDLPRGTSYDVVHKPNGAVEPVKKGKKPVGNKDSLLTMTGKIPAKGTAVEYARNLFEKLEAKHGIGNVSVQDLRTALKKNRKPWQLQGRLVTEKFLAYIDA